MSGTKYREFDADSQSVEKIPSKKVIAKFKPKTSCDVQGQSTKMIKLISHEISVPLAHVFKLSLSHGIFPEKLKSCRVIPIFKSGDQLDVDNYPPPSIYSSAIATRWCSSEKTSWKTAKERTILSPLQ